MQCHAMLLLWYAMFGRAMQRYATLRYAMLCCVVLCCATLCYDLIYYALCNSVSCYAIMLRYAMLCYAISICYATQCYAMLYYDMQRKNKPFRESSTEPRAWPAPGHRRVAGVGAPSLSLCLYLATCPCLLACLVRAFERGVCPTASATDRGQSKQEASKPSKQGRKKEGHGMESGKWQASPLCSVLLACLLAWLADR